MARSIADAVLKPCLAILAAAGLSFAARAAEVVVKNDSVVEGSTAAIQAGFVGGESAAVWLTSPCSGKVVAVQIFWRSLFGGTPQTLEDSITVRSAGTFPVPGPEKLNAGGPQTAFLEGPVMTDGFLNEFRFLDDAQSIPLDVTVTQGEVFVVEFKFFNSPNPFLGPSIVTDSDGCQVGKNAIKVNGTTWTSSCSLGVSGDFMIRAVVLCPDTGACCVAGVCSNGVSQPDCTAQGGTFLGSGSVCNANSCRGACCVPSTQQCTFVLQSVCNSVGGQFQGIGTNCSTVVCFPIGACCLPNGSCLGGQSPAQCTAQQGTFQGNATNCASVNCPIPEGACCVGTTCVDPVDQATCETGFGGVWLGANTVCVPTSCEIGTCPADIAPLGGNGQVNVDDLLAVINAWGPCPNPSNCPADIAPQPAGNDMVNVDDLLAVINGWGPCQ